MAYYGLPQAYPSPAIASPLIGAQAGANDLMIQSGAAAYPAANATVYRVYEYAVPVTTVATVPSVAPIGAAAPITASVPGAYGYPGAGAYGYPGAGAYGYPGMAGIPGAYGYPGAGAYGYPGAI